jgi:voltage-gated potassium channel
VFLDVSFVLLSFLSCIGALFQVHPRAEELEDSILSEEALAAYNAFVTIFTIAWVVSRFFLAKRKGDWEIVDDLPTIRSMYVRTWFAYDLLFTIPVDFVFVGWQWEVYGWMQLRHFLRLVRIFNLGSSHNPLLSSRLWFRFLSFCCFMVLTMHTLGCIFWALEPSWSYEESLYWAVATVTSVGYGDVVPRTTGGRVYVCFAMFFGIAMLSTMTAFATSFLTDKDKLQQEEESKKQMMYAMLEYYDVPWSVQKEVIAAVPALLDADNESEFKKMTAKLPPFVAHKIESYINVKMLRTVPIFADIDDMEALMDLSNRLTQQFYPAGEAITEQGASDRAMHFIIRGVVELVVLLDPDDEDGDGNFEAVVLGTLAPGSFFGEETLFEERERPETAQTISVVEVLTLTYDAFAAFTETHPGTSAIISDSLRRQQLHRAIDEGARGNSDTKMNPLVGASAFSAV